jgi:hypothetical protein
MDIRLLRLGTLLLLAAALASTAALGATTPARRSTAAAMPPASTFSSRVDNPWFPLVPGTRYRYTGVKDGLPSRDVVTVLHRARAIDGVRCAVVYDRLYLRGRLRERTTDWYSQDARGNVWYLGEDTAELDAKGRVTSTEGTWMAGVGGARAGVYMPAEPRVGMTGRQEFLRGQAEDHFRVIAVFRTALAPGARNAVLTEEWTPLEPGVLDHKMYVRGIGTVLEQTQKGGDERNELVSISRG